MAEPKRGAPTRFEMSATPTDYVLGLVTDVLRNNPQYQKTVDISDIIGYPTMPDGGLYGQYNLSKKQADIFGISNLPETEIVDTIMHELTHGRQHINDYKGTRRLLAMQDFDELNERALKAGLPSVTGDTMLRADDANEIVASIVPAYDRLINDGAQLPDYIQKLVSTERGRELTERAYFLSRNPEIRGGRHLPLNLPTE